MGRIGINSSFWGGEKDSGPLSNPVGAARPCFEAREDRLSGLTEGTTAMTRIARIQQVLDLFAPVLILYLGATLTVATASI